MSESEKEKKNSKVIVILLIVLIVLVIGGIITGVLLLLNKGDGENPSGGGGDGEPAVTIGYEQNGISVGLSKDDLQALYEQMEDQRDKGMIDLSYKHMAASLDGVNFACTIGNPPSNGCDVYLQILLDNDPEQQVLLTGLIPPGSELERFESEIPLEPGVHESALIFTKVDTDHATIIGQAAVVLRLVVTDEEDEVWGDLEEDDE